MNKRAFTLIEFLVAAGILAILAGIVIPYALRLHEMSNRAECARRLGQIGQALQAYEKFDHFVLPQTPGDPHKPSGYTAFTGPDDPHPYARDSAVQPNDITASLWLLVRGGYVRDLSLFICPSTSDVADRLTDAHGAVVSATQRGNFRGPENLSYSYACPFTNAYEFVFSTDQLPSDFALMADKNPGVVPPENGAKMLDVAKGNSPNHQQAGQNVLFPAGNVEFEDTPYCGVAHDNIYTVLSPQRLENTHPSLDQPGVVGRDVGPAYRDDSYLVPTAKDSAPQ